ncbi:MAG: divergent PAP2 family protein [Patescibacteria group bacterium]
MYSILILPIAAGLIAQLIKFFIKGNHSKWAIKNILAYSGMPSGHTAMVVSLSTIISLELGLSSPIFAISVVFAIIIIRDALGLRRYLGQHGRTLNVLVKDLKDDKVLDEKYPHHLERIGHTISQVLVGGLIGYLVSLLGFYLI